VLIATGTETGTWTLHATTRVLAAADRLSIQVPAQGAPATTPVLVSGNQRTEREVLPVLNFTADFHCGQPPVGREFRDNFAWIEVTNDAATNSTVDVSIRGPHLQAVDFLAYASDQPPLSADTGKDCLVMSPGSEFLSSLPTSGPQLARASGNGLVVPAHGSVSLLVATQHDTGDYTLTLSR
jgi:hypothetical protein